MILPLRQFSGALVLGIVVSLVQTAAALGPAAVQAKDKGAPKLTVRANPNVGFAPLRIVATAEFVGGANDYADDYCPRVEWQWGDLTTTNNDADCDPYVPGKSEIKRHYAAEHKFTEPGSYDVAVLFKQGDKTILTGKVTVHVQDVVASAHDRKSGISR